MADITRGLFFDLDDTLYPQLEDVQQRVQLAARQLGLPDALAADWLERWRRGGNENRQLIDEFIAAHGVTQGKEALLEAYRAATPVLALAEALKQRLVALRPHYRLFLITNGHPTIQGSKIASLGLSALMDRAVCAVEEKAKPSPYWAQQWMREFGLDPAQCIMFGDNPATDGAMAQAAAIHFRQVDYNSLLAELGALENL